MTTHPFSRAAHWVSVWTGRPQAFALAVLVVILWAVTGPLVQWSDTWQLTINTSTTIVTFLMVFLIQHSQNRDTAAIQLKLDELIRVNRAARNALIDIEHMTDEEIDALRKGFISLCHTEHRRKHGG